MSEQTDPKYANIGIQFFGGNYVSRTMPLEWATDFLDRFVRGEFEKKKGEPIFCYWTFSEDNRVVFRRGSITCISIYPYEGDYQKEFMQKNSALLEKIAKSHGEGDEWKGDRE